MVWDWLPWSGRGRVLLEPRGIGLCGCAELLSQDVEAGRPVELDALVAVVREIGHRVGEPTPCIDALLGLARLHARMRGLYP